MAGVNANDVFRDLFKVAIRPERDKVAKIIRSLRRDGKWETARVTSDMFCQSRVDALKKVIGGQIMQHGNIPYGISLDELLR